MKLIQMEIAGIGRTVYTPQAPPPRLFKTRKRGAGTAVPVFEPYEESLPLQSGHYSYVIDSQGRFRVRWGNTGSHAAIAGENQVAAAGRFSVNRAGSVFHVVCSSSDFKFFYDLRNQDPVVRYIIQSFKDHSAFALNENAVFQFHTKLLEKFYVTARGELLENPTGRLNLLESEGAGGVVVSRYSGDQRVGFRHYHPAQPAKLYGMHLDQGISALEGSTDADFHYGPPCPRLDLAQESLTAGKNNFVIDEEGWLIVGMTGHQILSGGGMVGGAGHVHLEPSGAISKLDLNFSGHYRPPLTAAYARYVFRLLAGHPLLTIAPSATYHGRLFDEIRISSTVIRFVKEELESDDDDLDSRIESVGLFS